MSKVALNQVIRFIIHQSELNIMAYLIVIYYLSKNDLHNSYKISDMVGKLSSMVISLRTNNFGQ